MADSKRAAPVALGFGAGWFRGGLCAVAAVYLGAVFCDGAGLSLAGAVLPRPLLYFTQVGRLFPQAAEATIHYRAEVYDCAQRRFVDFDERPLFPIHADDDESRFHRALFFYRREPAVLRALDDYIVRSHNRRVQSGQASTDDGPGRIGGVLLLSLRVPIPPPGSPLSRYVRLPLASYPKEQRTYWHLTATKRRDERCASSP